MDSRTGIIRSRSGNQENHLGLTSASKSVTNGSTPYKRWPSPETERKLFRLPRPTVPQAVILRVKIDCLRLPELRELLLVAAHQALSVVLLLDDLFEAKAATGRKKVIDFDYASMMVWRAIKDGACGSGTRQYDAAGRVVEQLETSRRIGKMICLSGGGTLSHERF
jgi:hypothetical protein